MSISAPGNAAGNARIFLAGQTTPALAAFVNSTMVHAMDYDDVHPMGAGHPSGPCWSTALAIAEHHGELAAPGVFLRPVEEPADVDAVRVAFEILYEEQRLQVFDPHFKALGSVRRHHVKGRPGGEEVTAG